MLSEDQFAAATFLLAKALADNEGLPWEEPCKSECFDRASFVLDFLESEEMLSL